MRDRKNTILYQKKKELEHNFNNDFEEVDGVPQHMQLRLNT